MTFGQIDTFDMLPNMLQAFSDALVDNGSIDHPPNRTFKYLKIPNVMEFYLNGSFPPIYRIKLDSHAAAPMLS